MTGNDEEGTGQGAGSGQGAGERKIKVDVEVDSKQMKELLEKLNAEEAKVKKLNEDLEAAKTDKDASKEKIENLETELETAKSKLKLIGEQRLNVKKTAILEKAKTVIKDGARLKVIEDGMKTIGDVRATEYFVDTLVKILEEGEEQYKSLIAEEREKLFGKDALEGLKTDKEELLKKFPDSKDKIEAITNPNDLKALKKELGVEEEGGNDGDGAGAGTGEGAGAGGEPPVGKGSAGSLKLKDAQGGEGGIGGYDSHEAMIRDLRRRSHSDDPEVAAEAKQILVEMFKKWTVAVKKEYEGQAPRGIKVEPEKQPTLKDMTKRGGEALPVKEDLI